MDMTEIYEIQISGEVGVMRLADTSRDEAVQRALGSLEKSPVKHAVIRVDLVGTHPDADNFLSLYQLVQNHLNSYAAFDGAWFETFGVEEEYVFSVRAECVWTIVDVDGLLWIIAGRHFVNRAGYLLTTKGWREQSEEYLIG